MRYPIFGLVFLVFAGCETEYAPVMETSFPLRQDYLVVSTPKAPVTKWNEPGMPPLLALDLPPEKMDADQKAFLKEKELNNIIDPRVLSSDEKRDFSDAMTKLFGTPQEPNISPEVLEDPAALQTLQLTPETLAHGGRVYQKYCQNCHGLIGDGNGPAGKYLLPMPRDYRQGLFKFINTEPQSFGAKPLRTDLYRTITRGLTGSPMPAFLLPEEDVQAVISYVIYLSLRGEAEYLTMRTAIKDGVENFPKEIGNHLKRILPRWSDSQKASLTIDPDPYFDADSEVNREKHLISAALGYEIFNDAQKGGCTTCHVNYGKGAPYQYDAWGTITRPRNLTVAVFRGGRHPEDLYTRIFGGIPGSGMPSHAHLKPKADAPNPTGHHSIWNLVHFIETLTNTPKRQMLQDPIRMKNLYNKYGIKEINIALD